MEPGRPRSQNGGGKGWSQAGHAPKTAEPERRTGCSRPEDKGEDARAAPEVAVKFSASRMWPESRAAMMKIPEVQVVSEDALDSFLEKFRSQSYRGRFHEEQWEEVNRTCGLRTCVAPPPAPGPLALEGERSASRF